MEIIRLFRKRPAFATSEFIASEFIPLGVSLAGGNSPFDGVYLLLNLKKGQIAHYVHDDFVSLTDIAPTFGALLENTKYNLENGVYSKMRQWSLRNWCANLLKIDPEYLQTIKN